MQVRKMTACLVGAGNRGCVYADYSLEHPEELSIVAVVEPNELRRGEAGDRYSIPQNMRFEKLDDFLALQVDCDFVINATMDAWHYQTAKKIMQAKYDMLLEKPIVNNEEELLDLQRTAKENGVKVNVCHVLRYTPFYKTLKTIIDSGKIGRIMTMELNEHVGISHFIDSFVRGKWNSVKGCGSGFLLQKSCHDMDLICWLNNASKPVRVTSIGNRSQFIKKNAPEGATKYCYNCPHNATCLYDAKKIHVDLDAMPFQTWAHLDKPLDTITKEEKIEDLKSSHYGLCAYETGGDINDRQIVSVEFENGSMSTFTMVGGASRAGRAIHIIGTHGEIEGYMESSKFVVRRFIRTETKYDFEEEEIDVTKDVHISVQYGGHGGGDYAIMHELIRYLQGDTSSVSITRIDDSINSHLVVYAAEKSIAERKTIEL